MQNVYTCMALYLIKCFWFLTTHIVTKVPLRLFIKFSFGILLDLSLVSFYRLIFVFPGFCSVIDSIIFIESVYYLCLFFLSQFLLFSHSFSIFLCPSVLLYFPSHSLVLLQSLPPSSPFRPSL